MNRRDALQKVAWVMGGAISAPTILSVLEGCKPNQSTDAMVQAFGLSGEQQNLLSELAEVIIPKTGTPGAKDAGVGPFIEKMLTDCYSPVQQSSFQAGLQVVADESKKLGGDFASLSSENKNAVMRTMLQKADDEAKANKSKQEVKVIDAESGAVKENAKAAEIPVPFFNLLKELTLFGYFSSEAGSTMALDYVPVPGKYEACIDLKPNQKAYAL